MQVNSTVRIRNVGSTEWADKHAGLVYKLPPQMEGFVPWPAAVLWFGDPSKIDIPGAERHRTKELARLRLRYGVYNHLGEGAWDDMTPDIEVYDLDGNPVNMILHDPNGDEVTPAQQTKLQEGIRDATVLDLQKQVKVLTQQIQQVSNQNVAQDQGEMFEDGPPPDAPDVSGSPTNSPTNSPVTVPPTPSMQSNIPRAPIVPTPGVTVGPTSRDPEPSDDDIPRSLEDIPQDTPTRVRIS